MGTLENPVWTVTEVGGLWLLLFLVLAWLAYQLFDAAKDALIDIIKIIKRISNP